MLGERIADLRKSKGISQEELGDILSTSRQAISKWERGEADPDISRLKDLAVYFNVSIDSTRARAQRPAASWSRCSATRY